MFLFWHLDDTNFTIFLMPTWNGGETRFSLHTNYTSIIFTRGYYLRLGYYWSLDNDFWNNNLHNLVILSFFIDEIDQCLFLLKNINWQLLFQGDPSLQAFWSIGALPLYNIITYQYTLQLSIQFLWPSYLSYPMWDRSQSPNSFWIEHFL